MLIHSQSKTCNVLNKFYDKSEIKITQVIDLVAQSNIVSKTFEPEKEC